MNAYIKIYVVSAVLLSAFTLRAADSADGDDTVRHPRSTKASSAAPNPNASADDNDWERHPRNTKATSAPPNQKAFAESGDSGQYTSPSSASSEKNPFVLYFCANENDGKAGGGSATDKGAPPAAKSSQAPASGLDYQALTKELEKAGIHGFGKIPNTPGNAALYKKCGVTENTLVFFAYNNDKLDVFAGERCTLANVVEYLKTFKDRYAAYLKEKR